MDVTVRSVAFFSNFAFHFTSIWEYFAVFKLKQSRESGSPTDCCIKSWKLNF